MCVTTEESKLLWGRKGHSDTVLTKVVDGEELSDEHVSKNPLINNKKHVA